MAEPANRTTVQQATCGYGFKQTRKTTLPKKIKNLKKTKTPEPTPVYRNQAQQNPPPAHPAGHSSPGAGALPGGGLRRHGLRGAAGLAPRRGDAGAAPKSWEGGGLAVVVKTVKRGRPFWLGLVESPPILEPILVKIGMLTGGTIWILTHGHVAVGQKWAPELNPGKWKLWTNTCGPFPGGSIFDPYPCRQFVEPHESMIW